MLKPAVANHSRSARDEFIDMSFREINYEVA